MSYDYFFIPKISPWPFHFGVSVGFAALSLLWFIFSNMYLWLIFSLIYMIIVVIFWWNDVRRESLYLGSHTYEMQDCLKLSFCLFILSECLFFLSIFWAFFHSCLNPSVFIGIIWPPYGIIPMDPFATPLLNTCILLSSAVTLTMSHGELLKGKDMTSSKWLLITLILGYLFTRFQYYEYQLAKFTFSDSVYGSCFYMGTGFHGMHVIVGTLFLIYCWIRLGISYDYSGEYSMSHHVSYEMAIWYWHFVDVVWLFLFISIYIWGS